MENDSAMARLLDAEKPKAVPINTPGADVAELEEDMEMLDRSLKLATDAANSRLVGWLTRKIDETQNSIDSATGMGPPEPEGRI